MTEPSSPAQQPTSAYPQPVTNTSAPQESSSTPLSRPSSFSSTSSSSSESDLPQSASHSRLSSRRDRLQRPQPATRQESASIIVPKEESVIQRSTAEYPPDDARAMSPRRNSKDLERLGAAARESLKDQARTLQSSLAALAERIDEVKSDHDKLESENRFLQDYIGGLTRNLGSSSGKAGKAKR